MSPRAADPSVRTALIAAAARIVAAESPRALTTRRLAAEVGTSTMAVYTHFGSMDEVRSAVRRDGFARLEADLGAVARTDDPVADLAALVAAYFANGVAHPELYRAMFVARPPQEADDPGEPIFTRLTEAVSRCVKAGRFHPDEPHAPQAWAAELWAMLHGLVTLAHAETVTGTQVAALLSDMTHRLAVGYGDDPAAARASVRSQEPSTP